MFNKPLPSCDLSGLPAAVLSRLTAGEAIAVVAGGQTRALIVPVPDRYAQTALDAWYRGRGMLALRRMQKRARASGIQALLLREINREICAARRAR
jgi:antitoxin (DNA-binding transcriptional repressor) of toxin-antitoxin stability system